MRVVIGVDRIEPLNVPMFVARGRIDYDVPFSLG
jgi:hypothetical protein